MVLAKKRTQCYNYCLGWHAVTSELFAPAVVASYFPWTTSAAPFPTRPQRVDAHSYSIVYDIVKSKCMYVCVCMNDNLTSITACSSCFTRTSFSVREAT